MAFVQTDRLPAVADAIHRTLLAAPGKRLKLDSLLARLRPGAAGREAVITHTLHELRAIGAVVGDDEALRIRDDVAGGLQSGGMRAVVLRSIIDDAGRREFWADEDADMSLEGGIDLARSMTWFLTLSVVEGPWSWDGPHAIGQKQADELPVKVIYNSTRWPFFVRWSGYLGLALPFGSNSVLPDPTAAVRPVVRALLEGRGSQPITALTKDLAERLPMLDGGTWRSKLASHVAPPPDGALSSSLSFALARMLRAGDIALDEGLGDASKVVLADGAGAYHAIRWTGKSG